MKIRIFYFLFCVLFLFSCRKENKHSVNFYYWKSKVAIGETEKKYFTQLHSQKLYIRVFDVDKTTENAPSPIAKIDSFNSAVLQTEYIPVIFITNRTVENLPKANITQLAQRIHQLTDQILSQSGISGYNEIQLDCDWTPSTRENYFFLIKELKSVSKKKLSCTLRLHQIKYKDKTGIPPVDKGYLMCYATSDPTEKSDRNTILNMDLLKDYLSTINSYPLAFDVALPLYSWGIVTNHLGKIRLINGLTTEELENKKFVKISENKYKSTEDQFLHSLYLNKDFTIDVETISPKLLAEAKEYLSIKINKPYDIVYYHLDNSFLQHFTLEDLQ